MTALSQYQRLECPGVWTPEPGARRINVIVSFGNSSLVISDGNNRALSHWSLAATERVNPDESPAFYSPTAEASELLEIDDDTMIEAIETVRRAVNRTRPVRGRLRVLGLVGSAAAVLALGVFWLPGALARHTVDVVPDPTRAEIGAQLFQAIDRVSGEPCRTTRGERALAKMHTRLVPPGAGGGLIVLPDGVRGAVSLPGGLILLDRRLVEDYDTPDVAAGYVLAELSRHEDPLMRLLDTAGVRATLRLLTTGTMSESILTDYAEALVATPPTPATIDQQLAEFARAKVSSTPYAYAKDVTGEATLPLIEADPMRGGDAVEVLADGDWVALQGICGQ